MPPHLAQNAVLEELPEQGGSCPPQPKLEPSVETVCEELLNEDVTMFDVNSSLDFYLSTPRDVMNDPLPCWQGRVSDPEDGRWHPSQVPATCQHICLTSKQPVVSSVAIRDKSGILLGSAEQERC